MSDEIKPSGLTQDPSIINGGNRLRLAREANQWSIDKIAIQLKVRSSQVEAMEQGDWKNICPDASFAKSYLRSYIQILNLPIEETLKEYGEMNGDPHAIHSVNLVGEELNMAQTSFKLPSFWRWVVGGLVLVVIVWQLLSQLPIAEMLGGVKP